jgi:hypothetical protein
VSRYSLARQVFANVGTSLGGRADAGNKVQILFAPLAVFKQDDVYHSAKKQARFTQPSPKISASLR